MPETLELGEDEQFEISVVEPPAEVKRRNRVTRALFAVAVCGSVFILVLLPLLWLPWGATAAPPPIATDPAPPPSPLPPPPLVPSPPPSSPPEDRVRFYEVKRVGGELLEHTRVVLPEHDLMYGVYENTADGRRRDNVYNAALWDLYFMTDLEIVGFVKLNVCHKPPIELLRDISIFWPVYFSLWDARSVYLELYRPDNCVPPDYAWDSANVSLREVWPVYFASEHAENNVRIGQPTLQYRCRTSANGCSESDESFMQWETASSVQEAFFSITPQDYVDHFVAKLLSTLAYEAARPVDIRFDVYSDEGVDAEGRRLARLCGWQRVYRDASAELNVSGTVSQVERGAEDAIDASLRAFGFRQRLFPLVTLYGMQIRGDVSHMWEPYAGTLSATTFSRVRYTARRVATHAGAGPLPIRFLQTVFSRDDAPEAGNVTVPSVTGNLRLSEASIGYFVTMIRNDEAGSLRRFINETIDAGTVFSGLDCAASQNDVAPFLDVRCRAVVRQR